MRLISDSTLEIISKPFKYVERIILILYITIYIGLLSVELSYVRILTKWFNTSVCLFLMYKFNPFRKHAFNENDGKIIFASALFMLTNLGITEVIKQTVNIRI